MKFYFTSWSAYSGDDVFDCAAVFKAENKNQANKIVREEFYGKYKEFDTDEYGNGFRSGGCREISQTDY